MYVESVVLDGFKSYGRRTEVPGFDPEFNAITGLNGSGKSNILDAICFVLGITNLSHVRATHLQELVYKNGQAGISKASVTITFDNGDKRRSPVGYENHDKISITRQVVIGGKNKYLLNGTNIQNNRVHDLFRSVQLNVNNPHFLIMQGRITKVLNMKPVEILGMIEEAVGTMLYESKKQQAQKTIEKKDAKIREINSILTEEILPQLTKLKEERGTYLQFQKVQRELEHLRKLYVAMSYFNAFQVSNKSKEDMDAIVNKVKDLKEEIIADDKKVEELKQKLKDLEQERDSELTSGLSELEQELKEKEKDAVKMEAAVKNFKESLHNEEKTLKQLQKSLQSDENAYESKQKMFGELESTYGKLRDEDSKAAEALKAAQARFEAIALGKFSTEDGKASDTLQQQIIKLKSEVSEAETRVKTSQMKLQHNERELKKLKVEMKKGDAEGKRDMDLMTTYETEVRQAQAKLTSIDYEEGAIEQLESERNGLRQQLSDLENHVNRATSKLPYLNVEYDDPEPNFDRSVVRGALAELITVKNEAHTTALSYAGGNKLSNVVINSSDASKKIFKRGNLRQRITFLALDQVRSKPISPKELQKAQQLVGSENAFRASDLIEFDREYRGAIDFAFGGVFVCSNLNTARTVSEALNRNCYTLEGDAVRVGGEMSGGAAPNGPPLLAQVSKIVKEKQAFYNLRKRYRQIEQSIKNNAQKAQEYNRVKNDLELKSHKLKQLEQRLRATAHHQRREEVRQMEEQNENLRKGIQEDSHFGKNSEQKIKELEYKIKNAKELKEKESKEAEKEIQRRKKEVEQARSKWSKKEAEEASLKLELEELKKSIADSTNQVEASHEHISNMKAEIRDAQASLERSKGDVLKAKEEVKKQKDMLSTKNKEIEKENEEIEKISKSNEEKQFKVQDLNGKINRASEEVRNAERTVRRLESEHNWISSEKVFFNEPGSVYDFSSINASETRQKIESLEQTQSKLQKTVNMRAMTLLDRGEERYKTVMNKKKTVEADKLKIEKVIEELDDLKKKELVTAFEKMNKDFGSIFSTLLPGANAKLQPPEGQTVLEGLEVKVGFGDLWKESLSELSGGQRSLVALSLILSLLLFKPAPLYILDEVDAALDLSHTENIGRMLKAHFKHSQFIVVSLKDGMFNNANVLFKTKFVDGMSCVTRTERNA